MIYDIIKKNVDIAEIYEEYISIIQQECVYLKKYDYELSENINSELKIFMNSNIDKNNHYLNILYWCLSYLDIKPICGGNKYDIGVTKNNKLLERFENSFEYILSSDICYDDKYHILEIYSKKRLRTYR